MLLVTCSYICIGYSCVTDAATAELVQAIHKCDLSQAYRVIDQLEKLEKSQRVFNLQLMLDYYGEVRPLEKELDKDEKINEFMCVIIIYHIAGKFGGNNVWQKLMDKILAKKFVG